MNAVLTRNLTAFMTTSAARLLRARLPRGTEGIVVTPTEDCWVRLGDASVVAAAENGHFCQADMPTVIRAWEGARISMLAAATAGQAAIEVYGRVAGETEIETGRAIVRSLALPLEFDCQHLPPHENNAGEIHQIGVHSGAAAQTTAANVPADAAINGRTALAFDGATDVLPVSGFDALTNAVARFTAAVVFEVAAAPAGDRALAAWSVAGSANARFQLGLTAAMGAFVSGRILDADAQGDVAGPAGDILPNTPTVLIADWDCTNAKLSAWINGRQVLEEAAWPNVTAGSTSASDSQAVNIGAANLAATIGHVAAIADAPATFDILHLNRGLARQWGVKVPAS